MKTCERIEYKGTLPDSFFPIADVLYAQYPFSNDESPELITQLFEMESPKNPAIIYTNHTDMRLVGIFPEEGTEAYFGFWETSNDLASNKAAFELLQADALAKGKEKIIGPIHFNTFQRYRLRLGEAPSWNQFDREPVNPPYYADLLVQLGFEQGLLFESRRIRSEHVPDVYKDKTPFLASLDSLPFEFIPLTPETWMQFRAELYDLVHAIFGRNPGFKPISKEQFELLYGASFAQKLCPHTSVLFREKESGKLAAMSFCHPNYWEGNFGSSYSPTFEQDYPLLPKKVMLAKTIGVHPDFRRQGLMSYLGAYGMLSFSDYYEEAIFCLVRFDNFSLQFLEGFPNERIEYALFEKTLN